MMLHIFINPEKKWQRRIKLVSILEVIFLSIIHDISVHLTTKSENKKRWLSFHPSLQIYNCVVTIYISKVYNLFFLTYYLSLSDMNWYNKNIFLKWHVNFVREASLDGLWLPLLGLKQIGLGSHHLLDWQSHEPCPIRCFPRAHKGVLLATWTAADQIRYQMDSRCPRTDGFRTSWRLNHCGSPELHIIDNLTSV